MLRLLAAALLTVQLAAAQDRTPPAREAPRALIDSLAAAELRFFYEWGQVWRLSEDARSARQASGTRATFSARNDSTRPRNQHLHCHPGTAAASARATQRPAAGGFQWTTRPGSMIKSAHSQFAVCPTWIFEQVDDGDERVSIDAGLLEKFRNPVTVARRSLIDLFNAAAASAPGDAWIAGQHIRLLVDAQMADSALQAASQCRAEGWWCASLSGYAFAKLNRHREADAAFETSLSRLAPDARCRWNDARVLLDTIARAKYSKLSCAERDSVNRILWWLTDPLFTVPGNERRAEHYVRKLQVAFRQALGRDERYDWTTKAGGDALAEMVERYGWPTYTWWGGPLNDRSHSGYLKGFQAPLHEPYTTFEYSRRRQRLTPSWHAIEFPMGARSSDWQIHAPSDESDEPGYELRWWPAEHYEAPYPLYQLDDGQVAMFRRDSASLVAIATDLAVAGLPRALNAELEAHFVVTPSPASIVSIAHTREPVGTRLVMHGETALGHAVAGIELPPSGTQKFGARSRFALAMPAPLTALAPGERAISEPVVLTVPVGDEPLPVDVYDALKLMATSTNVTGTRRIGVYWETYGFAAQDSVDVAVWIERYTSQGVLRRFANAMRITTDLNTPIATSWQEPQSRQSARVFGDIVPIIGRSVVLDVQGLPRGNYWLDVAVAKPGETPVRARRSITIQ